MRILGFLVQIPCFNPDFPGQFISAHVVSVLKIRRLPPLYHPPHHPKRHQIPSIMSSDTGPFYSMGLQTYRVPLALYATNREKLLNCLRSHDNTNLAGKVVYLEGGISTTRDATDHEPLFRQESYFHYLFGVREPDVCGCIELDTGRATLFIPKLPEDYATIMGRIKTCEEVREEYGVDEVRYVEDIEKYLLDIVARGGSSKTHETTSDDTEEKKDGSNHDSYNADDNIAESEEAEEKKDGSNHDSYNADDNNSASPSSSSAQILLMSGLNTDSGKTSQAPTLPKSLQPYANSTDHLHNLLAECRVVKSPYELQLMRHVTELTSLAHVYTMSRTQPGMMEYQSESLFKHYAYYNFGSRHLGYTAICGCGPNGAVLHYGHAGAPNDRQLQDGDMCLFDLGAEYSCYGSDVTCSFPANGKFTVKQRKVYEGVLNAQIAVYNMLKPGVSYVDCHKAAEKEILKALAGLNIVLPGDKTLEELVEMRLGAVFMPHGLGHLIGIDTHDVGGYNTGCPERILQPGLKSLRMARTMLEGMTLTVEPGCYFIDHLLDGAVADGSDFQQYINADVLGEFRGFGGVRLEDVVAITADACDNYTLCPRTVEEVKHVCGGGKWPPTKDEAPELRRTRLCDPNPLRPSGNL